MRDPLTSPAVAVEFRLSDGEVLAASWSLSDGDDVLRRVMDSVSAIPDWLDNPWKSWSVPQDAVTFSGDVKPGREDEAREFVAALAASGGEGEDGE